MLSSTRLVWAFFILLILGLLSACAARESRQVSVQSMSGAARDTPTPVMLFYRSPAPSLTPTVGITATMTPNDDPDYYYGGLVVTMDDAGRQIVLKKRQNFLLSLGKNYVWEVSVAPEDVISANTNITPEPGDQGIFVARSRGTAVLKAVGNPLCKYTTPICSRPSVLFEIEVLVE